MSIVEKIDRDITVGVITVSDTRTKETDKGGKLVIEKLSDINAVVEDDNHLIVTDDKNNIREAVKGLLEKGLDVVITTGGTGIAKRDVTIEAVSELFDKKSKDSVSYLECYRIQKTSGQEVFYLARLWGHTIINLSSAYLAQQVQ